MKKLDIKKVWNKIRSELEKGVPIKTLSEKFYIPAQRISAQKRKWDKEAYFKDSKYSKFHTVEYKQWREKVLSRDNYKCVICKRGKPEVKVLQADHIKSWSKYPEERFNVDNGRTLCLRCHKRTLNYGKKGGTYQNDPLTDSEWVKKETLLWKKYSIKKKLLKSISKSKIIKTTKNK